MTALADLYEKYSLNRRFDHPRNVTFENSYYGESKYPPDWGSRRADIEEPRGGRRDAIVEYQGGTCARCRSDITSEPFNCHHYRPLDSGGKHDLNNLIGLCLHCHSLIHPDVADLDGDWRQSALFPAEDADPRVATIRHPVTDYEKHRYLPGLALLEEHSYPGENEFALSEVTYALSPGDVFAAVADFDQLLTDMELEQNIPYCVRVINASGLPLYDATVELKLGSAGHHPVTISVRTGRDGKANFQLSSGISLKATVTKGLLGPEVFTDTVTDEPTMREVLLE
ncbi:HNH endonuclease [Haloarcula sediminis]|uniref:HNH endonuclease n=1 Tax=Haloarcula sediminis TaxID=3111777 RepID=UPI002D79DB16|nr:HNH endonuclease [Haloarcula sp. CK38]